MSLPAIAFPAKLCKSCGGREVEVVDTCSELALATRSSVASVDADDGVSGVDPADVAIGVSGLVGAPRELERAPIPSETREGSI